MSTEILNKKTCPHINIRPFMLDIYVENKKTMFKMCLKEITIVTDYSSREYDLFRKVRIKYDIAFRLVEKNGIITYIRTDNLCLIKRLIKKAGVLNKADLEDYYNDMEGGARSVRSRRTR